jgi:hypothetical protein
MGRRAGYRAGAVVLASIVGAALLSGSDQPVTANSYPHWQALPSPPLAARTHALGVAAGHRVLVLGGLRAGRPVHGGAAYDLRTGIWRRVTTPMAVTDADSATVAAGVVVVRHPRPGGSSWWRYDVREGTWSRMRDVPPRLSVPSAFGSEVYAVSGRRVGVYSVQLRRWTMLPADPRSPALRDATVAASRAGTVVTGRLPGSHGRLVADRWDGVRWHRSRVQAAAPVTAPPSGETRVSLGGRTLVVEGDRAWIRLP